MLGKWILPEVEYYRSSTLLLSPNKQALFRQGKLGYWQCHSLKPEHWQLQQLCFRRVGFKYDSPLPSNCVQVSLDSSHQHGWVIRVPSSNNMRISCPTETDKVQHWTHQYLHQSPTIDNLRTDFSSGRARAGSDWPFIPSWKKRIVCLEN